MRKEEAGGTASQALTCPHTHLIFRFLLKHANCSTILVGVSLPFFQLVARSPAPNTFPPVQRHLGGRLAVVSGVCFLPDCPVSESGSQAPHTDNDPRHSLICQAQKLPRQGPQLIKHLPMDQRQLEGKQTKFQKGKSTGSEQAASALRY